MENLKSVLLNALRSALRRTRDSEHEAAIQRFMRELNDAPDSDAGCKEFVDGQDSHWRIQFVFYLDTATISRLRDEFNLQLPVGIHN